MIEVNYSECSGCKKCETICSFVHTGKINKKYSRISVLNLYEKGIDGPVVCQQCEERYCLDCPENALSKGENGEIVYSPTKCTGCGLCEELCPIGAIELFEDIVYVCDLCGGKPRCVEVCTENALTYKEEKSEQKDLSEYRKRNKEDEITDVTEKRKNLVLDKTKEIRLKWRKE